MKMIFFAILSLGLAGCATQPAQIPHSEWRKDSDKLLRIFVKAYAPWSPEEFSQTFPVYQSRTIPLSRTWENDRYATVYKLGQKFEKFSRETVNSELKFDAKLIALKMDKESQKIETRRATGEVPFIPLTKFILDNVKYLVTPDAPARKINHGLARFRSYVRGTDNSLPLSDGLTAFTLARLEMLAAKRMRGFWPHRQEILRYLSESAKYITELEKVLGRTPEERWKRDLDELKLQDETYRQFLRKKILPFARSNHILPEKHYVSLLSEQGVPFSLKELRDEGKSIYQKTYPEFRRLLIEVAKENSLPSFEPGVVFAQLRKGDPVTAEVAKERAQGLVKANKLLALDEFPVYREHVLSPRYRDEAYPEAMLNAVVRNIYPGKELRMWITDSFNPTRIRKMELVTAYNTEAWARYAEELLYPYLSAREQLVFLQHKLLGASKMYLDPDYHLGQVSAAKIKEILMKELGYSDEFSEAQVRELMQNPGAGPVNYAGFLELLALRDSATGKNVSEKCWSDLILAMGVRPMFYIRDRQRAGLRCDDAP